MIKCDLQVSRQIRYLSFVAAVSVVCIHSNPIQTVSEAPLWLVEFGRWWTRIHDWAVPFFFLVSGFFFDRSMIDGSVRRSYSEIVANKFKTLILPYLFWGAVYGTLLWTPLWMVTNTVNHLPLFGNTFIGEPSFLRAVDRIVGIVRAGPANPVLWFVRVLIIVFLTSPLLFMLRCRFKWVFLLMAITGVLYFTPVSHPAPYETLFSICGYPFHIKLQGVAWFCLGMCISLFHVEFKVVPLWTLPLMMGLWIVAVCFRWLHVFPAFFIASMWCLSQRLVRHLPEQVPDWMQLTFWIYCAHGPICGWVGGAVRAVLGKSPVIYFCQVVVLPLVVISICIGFAVVVKKMFPKFYFVISGGR